MSMKKYNNDVPLETVFKNLLKDYKKVSEWNDKLAKYAKKLEKENKKLQESLATKKVLERDYASLIGKLRNYIKWKKAYKSMVVMLKRHGIPFKLERELLTEEDIELEIKELLNKDAV